MKIALIQHFLSHYRYSIFRKLSLSSNNQFILFSDIKGVAGIKTIDSAFGNIPLESGGLAWKFIKNFYIGKHLFWQTGIARLAFSRQFDAIIFLGNMYHLSTWLGVIFAKICGKKVFMWTHGFLRVETGFKGKVRFLFYSLADGLMLYGNRAKDILVKMGYPDNRLVVVYNSLDYDRQKNIRDSLSSDLIEDLKRHLFTYFDLPVLIFIGRLTPQKKLHQLVKASKILHDRLFPVNIIFVGSGSDMDRIVSMVANIGLSDYVHFYGETYDENEIGSLISLSNVCVSPGEVGLTCMHVLAYGIPVITHDDFDFQMPEVEAIQPGVTGDFFEKDNIASLANCIYNFLNLKLSRDIIKLKCIQVIETKYNSHVQVKIINNFIDNFCKKL